MEEVNEKWEWKTCYLSLKRKINEKQEGSILSFQSLSPSLELSNECQDSTFKLDIEMSKPFTLEDNLGYTWHKSWIIPEITVSFHDEDWKRLKTRKNSGNLKCQITGVVLMKNNYHYLEQIKLDKSGLQSFIEKEIKFSNYKFSRTSFQHNRNKFSLLIWTYFQKDNGEKVVISSMISTPLYVDSRKQARVSKEKPLIKNLPKVQIQHFFEPIKIFNGRKHAKLESTVSGFIEYYRAQSIRNKIKNPFYIAYHFSNGFKCYFNKEETKNPLKALKLVEGNRTDRTVLTLLALTDDYEHIKRIRHIFQKSLRYTAVNLEFSSDSFLEDQKWILISRKQVAEAYKQYYEDDHSLEGSQESFYPPCEKQYQFRTQIILQVGGYKRRCSEVRGNEKVKQQNIQI